MNQQLRETLEAAVICTEINTGNGARSRLPGWARKVNGDPDFEEIARRGRALLQPERGSTPLKTPAVFLVDGVHYSLSEMVSANSDDPEFCAWARCANVGEAFPAFVPCTRVR